MKRIAMLDHAAYCCDYGPWVGVVGWCTAACGGGMEQLIWTVSVNSSARSTVTVADCPGAASDSRALVAERQEGHGFDLIAERPSCFRMSPWTRAPECCSDKTHNLLIGNLHQQSTRNDEVEIHPGSEPKLAVASFVSRKR